MFRELSRSFVRLERDEITGEENDRFRNVQVETKVERPRCISESVHSDRFASGRIRQVDDTKDPTNYQTSSHR